MWKYFTKEHLLGSHFNGNLQNWILVILDGVIDPQKFFLGTLEQKQ